MSNDQRVRQSVLDWVSPICWSLLPMNLHNEPRPFDFRDSKLGSVSDSKLRIYP